MTLQQLPFVDAASIQDYEAVISTEGDKKITVVDWHCLHPKKRWCGNANLSANNLISLWMSVNYDLSFADAVRRLGPPDYVGYNSIYWAGTCEISLYWVDTGILISGENLMKACPSVEEATNGWAPNPNINVTAVHFGRPENFHLDSTFPQFYVAWHGLGEGPLLFLDFVPGDPPMWFIILASLGALILIAIWQRRWPSAAISFPLAGIATFLPTLQFQFSDVCIPTIIAYSQYITKSGRWLPRIGFAQSG